MDHAAAHERIEDLLLEPQRLAALETSTASADVALREHVAGCPACAGDLESWRRLQRAVAAAVPNDDPAALAAAVDPVELPPSLRAATIAAIRDTDRYAAGEPGRAIAIEPVSMVSGPKHRRLGPLLALAASLVLLVGAGAITVDQIAQRSAAQASANELAGAIAAVDRMLATDHKVVQLRDTSGQAAGTISWSRHDWVVLTDALPNPPPGSTYRCWLVEGGSRSMAVGKMDFSNGVAYWATSVDAWQTFEIGPTTEFIVTLESGGPAAPAAPGGHIVLSARLSS